MNTVETLARLYTSTLPQLPRDVEFVGNDVLFAYSDFELEFWLDNDSELRCWLKTDHKEKVLILLPEDPNSFSSFKTLINSLSPESKLHSSGEEQ